MPDTGGYAARSSEAHYRMQVPQVGGSLAGSFRAQSRR